MGGGRWEVGGGRWECELGCFWFPQVFRGRGSSDFLWRSCVFKGLSLTPASCWGCCCVVAVCRGAPCYGCTERRGQHRHRTKHHYTGRSLSLRARECRFVLNVQHWSGPFLLSTSGVSNLLEPESYFIDTESYEGQPV